jgi:predicted amidohydrolase
MKLALCQMNVGTEKQENLKNAEKMIREAEKMGADIIVLPEMFNCPYKNEYFDVFKETKNGTTITLIRKLAKELEVYIVAGSIPEDDDGFIYNTSFFIDRFGNIVDFHRKAHLFDIDVPGGITFKESDTLLPGNKSTVVDTEFGKIGIGICYDIRFPEFARKMVLEGAEILIYPAAFNMITGPAHWEITARTRALDNQVYVALCSPARDENGLYVAYGNSIVTDPWGKVIGKLDETEKILMCDIDYKKIEDTRNNLPLLKHRRENLY